MTPQSVDSRHAAELEQGVVFARADVERSWGWSGVAGRLRAERRASFLIERCGLGPGVRCLELGAGTGTFTNLLAATGCELVALELSPDTAAVCRTRVGPSVEVVVGDAETAEGLDKREFDAIVGVSVLHHLDLAAALATTFSHLVPGGRFAFSEPNILNPQVWAERRVGWVSRRRHVLPHERAFTAGSLRAELEAGGLDVDVAETFDFLHPATPRLLVSPVVWFESLLEHAPFVRAIAGSVRVAGRRPKGTTLGPCPPVV
jgi:SAM-dependent methyltransferase